MQSHEPEPTLYDLVDPVVQGAPALQAIGTQVKDALHSAVLEGGDTVRSAADVLHGVPLGHPLHPLLTDVTIGAWVFGAVFDGLSLLLPWTHNKNAADTLTGIGILSAIPTAAAGLTDFSTIKQDAADYGLLHALLNTFGLLLYILSWRARRRHLRITGIFLSMLGLGILTISAWIGGELTYRKRVGVNHSPKPSATDWTAVLPAADLPQAQLTRVDLEGQPVLLYRQGETISAIGAVCSHAGGPLEQGKVVDGCCVQCPWHDSVFDLRTGGVVHGPSTYGQPRYEARTRGGQVEVRFAAPG